MGEIFRLASRRLAVLNVLFFLHDSVTLLFLLTLFSDFNAGHLEHVLPLGAFALFVNERSGTILNKVIRLMSSC
jgi:hypothetical protein